MKRLFLALSITVMGLASAAPAVARCGPLSPPNCMNTPPQYICDRAARTGQPIPAGCAFGSGGVPRKPRVDPPFPTIPASPAYCSILKAAGKQLGRDLLLAECR
jgi:hypothetical protein